MASEVFGSLVGATCVNIVLYTLEIVMACQLPKKITRFKVWANVYFDTVATIAGCAFLYKFQGSHWGEEDDVQSRYWQFIVCVLVISAWATIAGQTFLLERFWRNIRHHLLGTAFAVSLLAIAMLACVASVVVCSYLQWTKAPLLIPFVWVALISNVVVAFGITTVSVCQRFAMKTGPGPKKNIIRRASGAFIETGIPSSIIVILALVAWAAGKHGAFVVGLYFLQARVYSCTMLFALRNPLPPRTDVWIEDMVSTSVPQKEQPAPPPLSPDIFLKNEKSNRLGTIPEEKTQGWYNIDLGTSDVERETSDDEAEDSLKAMVLHRNVAFYQVPDELKR
ncbi:hypothetical protein C8F04DRAFT_1080950 [Mycena alexandri]|uniref:Transmembrane protein n=1 Tax=Mycena alexandri TaxID=1745969 RepID=A0AAD6T848_9AGAR|nr:hypothetical protein C8F04DRAFT_1080950 [Mycena alexandri]